MLLGLVLATSGGWSCWAEQMPAAPRARCCPQVGAMVEGPAAYPHLSGRRNLALFDAMAPDGDRRTRRGAGRRRARAGRAGRRGRAAGPRVLPRHAAAARPRRRAAAAPAAAGARRADQRPRPAGHPGDPRAAARPQPGRARRSSSPATCSARSSRCAPGSASSTAAGWSSRPSSPSCSGRPAGSRCTPPTSTQVRALLDGVVEEYDGQRLLVRERRPRGAQRAAGAGRDPGHAARRRAAHASRRSCSRRRRRAADRFGPRGARMIRVELVKLLRSRRTWATIALIDALPALVAVLLAVTDLGPRPGTGPAFLSAVLTDGTLFPLAALGIVLPLFLPIAVAVTAGEAIAGEAQQGTLRYMLVRPVGRTRLLVRQARRGDGVRRADRAGRGRRRRTSSASCCSATRTSPPPAPPASPAARCRPRSWSGRTAPGPGLRDALHARRGRGRAVPVHGHRVAAGRGARHAWRCWSPPPCCSPSTPPTRCSPTCRPATGWPSSTCSETRSCGATCVRGVLLQVRLRRGVPRRRLGQLHDQGRHRLSARAG